MNYIKHFLKLSLLFIVLVYCFSSKIYSQNTLYVDRIIDTAEFYKYRDYNYSLELTRKGLEIAVDSNYNKSKVNALNLLAYLYSKYLHKHDSANLFIYEAYNLSKNINYKNGICEFYFMKGFLSQEGWNDEHAKKFYTKSLQLANELNDYNRIANSQYSLAFILVNEEKHIQALNEFEKAYINYKECENRYGEARCLFLKGLVYLETQKSDSSLVSFKGARSIYKNISDTFFTYSCDFQEAVVWLDQKEYEKAIPILKNCSEIKAKNVRAKSLKYIAINKLSKLYAELGQYEKAFKYNQMYQDYADSAYSTKQINNVNNIRVDYESQLKELEKAALKTRIRKDRTIIWLIIFVFIQALIFAILIYRKYKIIKDTSEKLHYQQKLNYEQERELEKRKSEAIQRNLEYKKRELAVKVFQIFQGSQLTQKLLLDLQALRLMIKTKGKHGEDIRDNIKNMINNVKFNTNVQIWDEFEMYFNKVTPGFKKWLTNSYSDLTSNEIRLCFFAQMNLQTKEIANITLQSSNSINVARKRLRKKLGINDQNTSLSTFLECEFSKFNEEKEFIQDKY